MEKDSGRDVTVDMNEIAVLIIVKKSKAVLGLLAGGAIGALLGVALYKEPKPRKTTGLHIDVDIHLTKGAYAIGGGLLGGLIGAVSGEIEGLDKIIQIEGKSDAEIEKIMEKLRKKARMPNFI